MDLVLEKMVQYGNFKKLAGKMQKNILNIVGDQQVNTTPHCDIC